jgi:hypothetical protein
LSGERRTETREGRTNPDSTLLVVHTDMRGDLSKLGRIGVRVLVVDLAEDDDGFLGVGGEGEASKEGSATKEKEGKRGHRRTLEKLLPS